jgi:nitrogen fixation/metabolism regulation signal transduction histidine kinase
MDAMVIATNEQGYVVMANASANKLILNDANDITGIQLSSLALGKQMLDTDTGIINVKTSPINQISGEHFLSKESFLSDGKQHQLYIMTNAERLLMEKERKAWQGLIRVLNHEMNNSLTPVIAISQSMQKKLQAPDGNIDNVSLLNGVNIINERADSLSQFIDNFSQLSHLPKPNKTTFSLTPLIESISSLYPMCIIHCKINTSLLVEADKNQFEQVLINLIKNAIEAMSQIEAKQIEISAKKTIDWLNISIRDHGVGITNFDNIFVPFYTTKTQGSGIGLALCRQIMFNHNGLIKIHNYQDDHPINHKKNEGVEVVLSLPVDAEVRYSI